MENWSPKPLRPVFNLPTEEGEYTVVKSSPIVRQRQEDGTQHSFERIGFKPADPQLYIGKGSLAEKLPPAPTTPKADPPVYDLEKLAEVVKAYLNS